MPESFFISTKGIIIQNKKVLVLIKERNLKTYYDLPGGRVDKGETLEETIKREILEELPGAKDISVISQIGDTWELPQELILSGDRQLTVFFLMNANLDEFSISNEHDEFKWVNLNELDENIILLQGYEVAIRETLLLV